ncbi:MAG: sulfite reductase [Desulfobacteraceae bacterium]|nr:MAG: sulfite reductase [Desulfobacteraceae bacterium]
MAVDREQLKAALIEYASKSTKPQLYLKDLGKAVPDASPREVKNAANDLVKDGKMVYWSSGSSTMYAVVGRQQDEEKK